MGEELISSQNTWVFSLCGEMVRDSMLVSERGTLSPGACWEVWSVVPWPLCWKSLLRSREEAREWVLCGRGGGVGGSSIFFMASSMEVLEYDLTDKRGQRSAFTGDARQLQNRLNARMRRVRAYRAF